MTKYKAHYHAIEGIGRDNSYHNDNTMSILETLIATNGAVIWLSTMHRQE